MSSGRRARLVITAAALLATAACTTADPPAPTPTPTNPPTVSASAPPSSSATPTPTEIVEPTTSNTLPPPPNPSTPAPTRAGDLTAASLPVPAGWRTVVREGGAEEGYQGNGTWVHGRDPRYAAYESITMGCAPVTRDDYPDPRRALEGTYERGDDPGVALIMEFADGDRAEAYLATYRAQVERCTDPDTLVAEIEPVGTGLVDRRSYPDGEWTEVVRRNGNRLTVVLLSDPGHDVTTAQIRDLQARIDAAARR